MGTPTLEVQAQCRSRVLVDVVQFMIQTSFHFGSQEVKYFIQLAVRLHFLIAIHFAPSRIRASQRACGPSSQRHEHVIVEVVEYSHNDDPNMIPRSLVKAQQCAILRFLKAPMQNGDEPVV